MHRFGAGAQFAEVPIFPLPEMALFPGAILPLHIFEPRYRLMTEAALGSDQLLCMVGLAGDSEGQDSQPAVARVGGLGQIIDHARLPDGRFHLLLRGQCRVQLKELAFRPPYRRATLSVLTSFGEDPTADDRRALEAAIAERLARLRAERSGLGFEYPADLPTDSLIDLCGQYLLEDGELRQELLETLEVNARLRCCLKALLEPRGNLSVAN